MAYLILQTMQVADTNFTGSTATLRIFASAAFYESSTSEYIPVGRVNDLNSCYQSIACTVSSGTVTIPTVTLATTTDSNVQNAKYTAILYSATNRKYVFLSNFFVDPEFLQTPAQSSVLVQDAGSSAVNGIYTYRGLNEGFPYYNLQGQSDSTTAFAVVRAAATPYLVLDGVGAIDYSCNSSTDVPWDDAYSVSAGVAPAPTVSEYALLVTGTWEQLTISNQAFGSPGAPFQFNSPFWNVQQTKDYIDSVIGSGTATPFASRLIVGKTALDEDPVLSTQPTAVAINSNRINRVLSEDYDNDLADAITASGSTPTTLIVKEGATVSTALVIPSTLYLQFEQGAVLTKSGSGAIEFEGVGLVYPESQIPIFSGFAADNITWTGSTWPARISSSLWSNATWDARLIRACNAFTDMEVTVIGYPGGSLTTQIEVFEQQSLYLTKGEYTNSGTGADEAGIILNSNTEIYGDGMGVTRIQEPPTVGNIRVIGAKHTGVYPYDGFNDNILVHDLTIYGNGVQRSNSERASILLGNGSNLHIYRCEGYFVHGFFAYVGLFGSTGNTADGWSITDCVSRGTVSQAIGCITGRNGIISNNQFLDIQPVLYYVTDGVTNGTTTVTSASGAFDPAMSSGFIRILKPGQTTHVTTIASVSSAHTIILATLCPFSTTGASVELIGAICAPIDLEPSSGGGWLENIQITNNIFDGRNAQQSYNAIAVQGADVMGAKNINVSGNIVVGTDAIQPIFYASGVDTGANTITLLDHQMETGQVVNLTNIAGALPTGLAANTDYYIIRVDNDTFKLAWAYGYAQDGTAIDISNAGSGRSAVVPRSHLVVGITVEGAFNARITENDVQRATQNGIAIYNSAEVVVHDNKCLSVGGGGIPGMTFSGNVYASIDRNIIRTPPTTVGISTSTDVTEDEVTGITVNTAATLVTITNANRARRWWTGLTVTINAVDYTVESVQDAYNFTLTGTAGTQTGVAMSTKFSANTYKDNQWGTLTLSSVGTSQVYSVYTDRVAAAPATTTDNAIVRWDGITGRAIQNSSVIVEDNNVLRTTINLVGGYATTATAAGTTTLTVASAGTQVFTGATTQTVTLPVVTTLFQAGLTYRIVNQSTGLVTVNSSGGNAVMILGAGTTLYVTNNKITADTTAAAWTTTYVGTSTASGKVATFSNTITYAGTDGTTMTFPGVSASVAPLVSPSFTTPALGVATGTSLTATGLIKSSSASAGIGYATGAGNVVTQGTNRTTAVNINAMTGAITLFSAAGSATPASFTVNNTSCAATDVPIVVQKSGTDKYELHVTAVGANTFEITFFTTGGTTVEQPVFSFAIIKGVTS